ncbi:hypothetical protein ACLOJK_007989 [Asimina triloba]
MIDLGIRHNKLVSELNPSTPPPSVCRIRPASIRSIICQRRPALCPSRRRNEPIRLTMPDPSAALPATSAAFLLSVRWQPSVDPARRLLLAAVQWSLLFGEEGGAPYYGAPVAHQTQYTLSVIRYSSGARNFGAPTSSFGTTVVHTIL